MMGLICYFLGMRIRTSRLALNPGLAEDEEDSETEFQQDDPLGKVFFQWITSRQVDKIFTSPEPKAHKVSL